MTSYSYIIWILLLPLVSFALLGIWGRKYFNRTAGIIATSLLFASTVLSVYTAWQYFFNAGPVNGVYQQVIAFKYTWLTFSPGLAINMGAMLDPASVMMIVVVNFISLMVHIFSLGYMKGEERFATYYAFLGLFTFSMLGLVLSSNIFQIYIFWELVGLSSFLLIGFYYSKPAAVAAAKKAFIVTRFADLGFLVGILILSYYSGTLDFDSLINSLTTAQSSEYAKITSSSFLGISALTWALALVFIGGAGKSALFPLHIWLPDAMEGPTPVSALIHAATMVVAGVFLVARLFPVFSLDAAVMQLATWVGIISAIIAAIIACTQTDIKRILAFSTMSQIGYMMFALGLSGTGGEISGYSASLFHLFTHAFFKSLLFLAAGLIIHRIHSNNILDMGGLRKIMPVTHIAFVTGCLAIAGIPPFAGYFSKEEILFVAFRSDKLIYLLALITAGITAFYMFRLYFSVFWNKPSKLAPSHHSQGSFSMKGPLILLTVCSLAAGFVPFSRYVTATGSPVSIHPDLLFSLPPVLLVIASILLAARLYKKENNKPALLAASTGSFYRWTRDKFYVDDLYLFITKKIIFNLVGRPAAWIDKNIVDGLINGLGQLTTSASNRIKGLQSGKIQNYTLYFFAAALALAALFIYLW